MFGILARAARLPIVARRLSLAKGPIKQRYRYSSTNGAGGPNQAPLNLPVDTARMWEWLGHVEAGVHAEMVSMMEGIKLLGWRSTAALVAFIGSLGYAAYTIDQVKRDLPNTIVDVLLDKHIIAIPSLPPPQPAPATPTKQA
ncbi:hypothetical protein B9Z19DRAFT_1107669 [Tuber borchii]|uniref:Uncharacterized protein n=1 Tax=Tuber borchii TaxID=42251 RepID=A0A2T6ZVD0_TUBBO|nr:hypothetical protein B9Z19DRAFT_1107669 [Tuber borchii]